MRNLFYLFVFCLSFIACQNQKEQPKTGRLVTVKDTLFTKEKPPFAIAIHGGAGYIVKENLSDSLENAYRSKLKEAISKGNEILKNGGKAVDAVSQTIQILEASPLFNAGVGAVLTNQAEAELDASIMNGKTLNAGAVAGVKNVKSPIALAQEVMLSSKHVLLAREGAEAFAKQQGLAMVDSGYFVTPKQLKTLQRLKKEDSLKQASNYDPFLKNSKFGTVGCVALDKEGNLAAGTSTGGMANKKWGRIGDSPIIGAGTYANNKTCAISSTGWGEYYIRGVLAYDVSALMEYKGFSLEKATREVIHKKLPKMGGNGGMIALDKNGNISMPFNTKGMFRASYVNGELRINLFKEE